jgi:Ricin-type beta-trefoil lectin domain.
MNQASGPASLLPCTHLPVLTQMFVMKLPTDLIATDESVCLDVPEYENDISPRVRILACSGFNRQRWTYDKEVRLGNTGIKLTVPNRLKLSNVARG